jgi:hypothetical protein
VNNPSHGISPSPLGAADLQHPDIHTPWSQWQEEQTLHIVIPYSNCFRWRTRRELVNDCIRHLRGMANVDLHVVELAYGDRPFEVTGGHVNDVQLRTTSELWHKEQLINIGVSRFPVDWKYGAYVDGDFHFTRHDLAMEAIHQLQHYDFVQLFSSYADLTGETYGTGHRPLRVNNGFAYNYIQNGYRLPEGYENGGWKQSTAATQAETAPRSDIATQSDLGGYGAAMTSAALIDGSAPSAPGPSGSIVTGSKMGGSKFGAGLSAGLGVGATGGAWAWRRSAFDTVGGMLDVCALGHGDWFMTFGLVGELAPDMHVNGYTADYLGAIAAWQRNAAKLNKNIGYVDCFATHHFHGAKSRRGYSSRDTLLVKHQYSPTADLSKDWQGVYTLSGNKPAMRDDFRRYFISRSEDDPGLYGDAPSLTK